MKKEPVNKLTYEEVYNTFKEYGYELLDKEYKNRKEKMDIIDEDGYKYKVSYGMLNNLNTKFPYVHQNNPYSIYNIKQYLKNNSIELELLEKEYISNTYKMKCKCSCGEIFNTSWASISKKHKYTCNNCSKKKQTDTQKDNIKDIKELMRKYGNELLTQNYINQNQKLKIQCKCGKIYYQTSARFKQGKMVNCADCCDKLTIFHNINKAYKLNFTKEDYFPCKFCYLDCKGVHTCKIFSVLKHTKRKNPIGGWSGREYFTIFNEIINNNESVLNNILGKLEDKNIEDLCSLLSTELKIGGKKELKIIKKCSVCGKEIKRKLHQYNCKYAYCSKECKSKQSILMINNGTIKNTLTMPHKQINLLLDKMSIKYENEYILKYHSIDIFSKENNLLIEIMGNYWHGIPIKYHKEELSDIQKKDIKQDKSKYTYVKKYYNKNILYLWESDIKNNILLCEKLILLYIKNNGKLLDYQSYNYHLNKNNELEINDLIINPYFITNKIS